MPKLDLDDYFWADKRMNELKSFVPQGWQCPICGRVYSPTTMFCLCCGGKGTTNVTSGTYVVPEDMRGEEKDE